MDNINTNNTRDLQPKIKSSARKWAPQTKHKLNTSATEEVIKLSRLQKVTVTAIYFRTIQVLLMLLLHEAGVRGRWWAAVVPQISAGYVQSAVACHHVPRLLRMLLLQLLLLLLLLLLLMQRVQGSAELVLMMLRRQTGQLGVLLLHLAAHPRQHNSLCECVFAVAVSM